MGRMRQRMKHALGKKTNKLLGIPRYMIREYPECRLSQLYHRMCGRRSKSFSCRTRAWKLEGMLFESLFGPKQETQLNRK